MTRIVGGMARGRQLAVPAGDAVRPTADRVKEALFSAVGNRAQSATVIDLYAGSGALGLEALSRGARHITFVERSARVIDVLEVNIANVMQHLTDSEDITTTVIAGDVPNVLSRPALGGAFDLAFADPPYTVSSTTVIDIVELLAPHLVVGALVVIERPTHSPTLVWPDNFGNERARRYGDTTIHRAELQTPPRRST